jgi:hypothetical protein
MPAKPIIEMIDSQFTHPRLGACTRRIAAASSDTKANQP